MKADQNVDEKPVEWLGDSLDTLKTFSTSVCRSVGFALQFAQDGEKAPSAKPLKGIVKRSGVLEIVEDFDGDTYRAVYTVKFEGYVYVLHCFQKKSKSGIKTPPKITKPRNRRKTNSNEEKPMSEDEIKITRSSGNVFADLGLPDADDLKFKTGLVIQIHKLINSRKLTQVEASKLVNVSQPKLSALLRGDFAGFSTDRLFRMLRDLGQDIEIKITPAEKPTQIGSVTVLMPRTTRKSATVAAKTAKPRMQG